MRSSASTAGAGVDRPFHDAIALHPLDGGRYGAELGTRFTVGPKAHGGLLMALLARAGLARVAAEVPGPAPDPLAVAADYLRAPDPGPVELATEVLKLGRTVSVLAVRMHQNGRTVLASTVTTGRLPDGDADWADLPAMPAEPAPDAVDPAASDADAPGVSSACEVRYDPSTLAFARGEKGPPLLRGWARPRGEPADVLFALLAGDVMAPTVFNLTGRAGWAPTVQLTALLRARPAPGWLRVEARTVSAAGGWFDEDATVVDAAGRLVCQARQLALSPL